MSRAPKTIVVAISAAALFAAVLVASLQRDDRNALADPPAGGSTACATPNREAIVTKPIRPEYPASVVGLDLDLTSVLVRVVIDPSGNVTQATIYRSSGNSALDESARKAALASKYAPKRIACQAVTAVYLFRADFDPEGYAPVTADLPHDTQWNNPFCDGAAVLLPMNSRTDRTGFRPADTYALYVWANGKSDFAARISLIGDGVAYSVDVPKTRLTNSGGDVFGPAAFLVTFPHRVGIWAFFVDGVGVDDKPVSDCPSYVKTVANAEESAPQTVSPATMPRVVPRLLQDIPSSNCATTYSPLQSIKEFQPVVGYFGDRPRTAQVEVFVDSSGNVVRTRIWKSSGVDGIDAAATAAVQYSTYRPARFLCTPVVSSGIYAIDYRP